MIVEAFKETLELGLQKPEQTVVCITSLVIDRLLSASQCSRDAATQRVLGWDIRDNLELDRRLAGVLRHKPYPLCSIIRPPNLVSLSKTLLLLSPTFLVFPEI